MPRWPNDSGGISTERNKMKMIQFIKLNSLVFAMLMMSGTLQAQPLAVAISQNPTNVHDFFLDVLNMQVGGLYGIGAKNAPSPDPFEVWPLISVFEAEGPAMRFEASAGFPQR